MRPDSGDPAYLWDMLEAAREAIEFVGDLDLATFIENRRVLLAVERELEIIGEAARRVSPSLRDSHPEIPWKQIIGQRNVLAHDYGEVDPALIWNVPRYRLPELAHQLSSILPGSGI